MAFPALTFQNPVTLLPLPGTGQLVVAEREGRVYSFQNDPATSAKTLILDLSAVTQGWDDCGLISLVFHPEFGVPGSPNRGFLYVYHQYTDSPVPGPGRPPIGTETYNRLVRYTIPDGSFLVDVASETVLLQQHDRSVWHNGGAMFFHPVDGFLYFTIGDEGGLGDLYDSAQKIDDKLFSGVFRIDVDMQRRRHQPPDPPAAAELSRPPLLHAALLHPQRQPVAGCGRRGARGVLWALGLRNPLPDDATTRRPTSHSWSATSARIGAGRRSTSSRPATTISGPT